MSCSGILAPWHHPLPDPAALELPIRQRLPAVHSWADVLEPGKRDCFHLGCLKASQVQMQPPSTMQSKVEALPSHHCGASAVCSPHCVWGRHLKGLLVHPGQAS